MSFQWFQLNELSMVPIECFDDLHRSLANPPENMRALEDHVRLIEEKIVLLSAWDIRSVRTKSCKIRSSLHSRWTLH